MTSTLQDLLQRRFALVGALSELNARSHKLIQERSAIEMEALRLELEIGRNPDDEKLVRELQEADDLMSRLDAAQAVCGAEIETVEAEMGAIDAQIAFARGGET